MLDQLFSDDIVLGNEGDLTLNDFLSDQSLDVSFIDPTFYSQNDFPLHSTFDNSFIELLPFLDCDISRIPRKADDAAQLDFSDFEGEFFLDAALFFSENGEVPVMIECAQRAEPLTVSTDQIRLEQNEDKATDPKTQSSATQTNNSFTPSFKAAVQRQNQITQPPLLPRQSKLDAIDKLKKFASDKKI